MLYNTVSSLSFWNILPRVNLMTVFRIQLVDSMLHQSAWFVTPIMHTASGLHLSPESRMLWTPAAALGSIICQLLQKMTQHKPCFITVKIVALGDVALCCKLMQCNTGGQCMLAERDHFSSTGGIRVWLVS